MAKGPVIPGRVREILNPALALYLLVTGAMAIVVPVPDIPTVFALLALALLNHRSLNRPARIIGGWYWGSFSGGGAAAGSTPPALSRG